MPKVKTTWYCQNCGSSSAKWIGKCPSCNEWNTYVEEVLDPGNKEEEIIQTNGRSAGPTRMTDVDAGEETRSHLTDPELNRVLGGGLVDGSVTLLGGEPGIGKSTLLLQLLLQFGRGRTVYISGEESKQQVKMRAERVGGDMENIYLLSETSTRKIFPVIKEIEPEVIVVDSIQTLQSPLIESTAGSVSQIRQCAAEFQKFAKETGIPVFLVGHITKEGQIAGPKVLEHVVDTVLQFEGDRHHNYRVLRTIKNRFGSAAELGIYEMRSTGLRPVTNPSEILISQHQDKLSGITIAATVEGIRPILIEVQALVSTAVYGTPQRSSTGFDLRRLSMLLAVLEKRCGFQFGGMDVFLNLAGGIKVEDPAMDMAVVTALLSSFEDKHVPFSSCFAGEIGLSGEIRPVSRIEQRISEAEKLGFKRIYISKNHKEFKDGSAKHKIEVVTLSNVEQLHQNLY